MIEQEVECGEILENDEDIDEKGKSNNGTVEGNKSGVINTNLDVEKSQGQGNQETKPSTMCSQCGIASSKYTCPRCSLRTCSLRCCQDHKLSTACDGVRPKPLPKFEKIKGYSGFSENRSVEDQHFLHAIKSTILNKPSVLESSASNIDRDALDKSLIDTIFSESEKFGDFTGSGTNGEVLDDVSPLSKKAEFLVNGAHFRRIWFSITREGSNESRYDKYADTIFWTVTLKFTWRPVMSPEVGVESTSGIFEESLTTTSSNHLPCEYDMYTVHNIPESLKVQTLIQQFLKPKLHGPVVSRSDLRMEKMQKFIDVGLDGIMVYMKVPVKGKDRYYVVDSSKTLLENLRNRFVQNHPCFIVTLNNQFDDFVMLSEEEAKELSEMWRISPQQLSGGKVMHRQNKFNSRNHHNGDRRNEHYYPYRNDGRSRQFNGKRQNDFRGGGRGGFRQNNGHQKWNNPGQRSGFGNNFNQGNWTNKTGRHVDYDSVEQCMENAHWQSVEMNRVPSNN